MSHENIDVDSTQLSPKQKKQRTDIDDDALPVDAAIIFSTVNVNASSSSSRRVTMNMLGNDEQDETTNVADGSTIAENQDEDELLPADVDSQHADITTKIVTPNTTQKAKQVAAFSMPWLQQYGNDGFTLFDSDDDGEYHASPSYGFSVRISDDGRKVDVTNLTNN